MKLSEFEQSLCRHIESNEAKSVAMLSDLVGFASELGNEQDAQEYMAATFSAMGLDVDKFEIDKEKIQNLPGYSPSIIDYRGRENIVGIFKSKLEDKNNNNRSLIFNGHIDVVPTGPLARWQGDPFVARVEGDKLFGRGSGDMKAGIVAYCMAFRAIKEMGYVPAADIFFQSVIEEECTGNGALACLQRGYTADAAIIPEPFSQTMMISQLGVMWLQVKVSGKPAHVLDTSAGVNAIEAAYSIFSHLKVLEEEWNKPHARDMNFCNHVHPINFNLGKIVGGDWSSTVPTECSMDIRVGFYPSMDLEEVKTQLEANINEALQLPENIGKVQAEISYQGFQAEGFDGDVELPLYKKLSEAHASITGSEVELLASTATTDARFFHLYGNIPATCYGPVAGDYHSFNEWVSISSMSEVTKVLAVFISRWCGVQKI